MAPANGDSSNFVQGSSSAPKDDGHHRDGDASVDVSLPDDPVADDGPLKFTFSWRKYYFRRMRTRRVRPNPQR